MSYQIARRAFLRSCGASALLLPLLRNIEAQAQTGQAPKRFLVIQHPIGTTLNLWRPTATATTTTFTLPYISAPFEPLRSNMVMVDGLNIVAATRVAAGPTGDKTHEGGMVAIMTGQPTLGRIGQQDHSAGGPSIDQILLDQSPILGGMASATKTPFGSLQLAADIRSDRSEVSPRVMSYRAPTDGQSDINLARKPLYPDTQPLNVYNRIFGATSGGSTDTTQAAALLAQKKSALDFMRADLNRMRTLVPASQKDKLDQHAQAIQSLEATLQRTILSGGMTGMCTKPMAPPSFTQNGRGQSGSTLSGADYYTPGQANNHPHQDIGRAQLAMIRAAFACDLVRVATFMWSSGTNWVVFPGNFNGKQITGNLESTPHHPPTHTTDQATIDWVTEIDRWYAQQTAEALAEFKTQADVDGGNLLENTVVVYLSEVARAHDHDFRNVPLMVFGSPKVRIEGGRFLKATGGSLSRAEGGTGNRPTNDLWLALAPIFGVNMTQLGAATQYTGALPGLVSPA